jgi:hypothetical protein
MTVSVWNQITIDFYGHSVSASYVVENDTTITVKTPQGEKAARLRNSSPHWLAERLLRELAAERKA